MFRIEMLPAREGDCLIVCYGDANKPRRILIDGGRLATWRDHLRAHLEDLPDDQREFELLIVTHVDRDHIEGILAMLEDENLGVSFREVWFNGFHHLSDEDFEDFGPVQGEKLSEWLVEGVKRGNFLWNGRFGNDYRKAVALAADRTLLNIDLEGGMRLTLLSPSRDKLLKLIPVWEEKVKNAGMVAGTAAAEPVPAGFEAFSGINIDDLADEPFEKDPSEANGSSIAVLAEYGGKRVLFSGDAHVDLLLDSLVQLTDDNTAAKLDAFKIPHHGSRKNISKELLEAIDCKRYLISTNGAQFHHPDPVAMSRIIKYGGPGKEIYFNYRSDENQIWDVPSWKQDYDYELHYPGNDADGYHAVDIE